MPLGNPISLTQNVAQREIRELATEDQTLFTVDGGYMVNQLDVYRNGVLLNMNDDYTALDGSTVTLVNQCVANDEIVFRIYDTFRVADAIVSAASTQTISGNVAISSDLYVDGTIVGDGSALTNLPSTGSIPSYAFVSHQQSSGVNGGALVAGWQTQPLNTEDDPDGIVTLSNNEFTLGAGSYLIEWTAPASDNVGQRSKLTNVTTNSVQALGTSCKSSGEGKYSEGSIKVVITTNTTYKIETFAVQGSFGNTDGLGGAVSSGINELYASATIIKY